MFVAVKNLASTMIPSTLSVIEWDRTSSSCNSTSAYYANFQQTYSRLLVSIGIQRQSSYYIWKIVLGSVLLVIMAIAVFTLQVHQPDRILGTLTIFLALISFLFVAGTSIPKVAYQTRLDLFMDFSFIVVFLLVIAHVVVYTVRLSVPDRIQKPYRSRSSVNEMTVAPSHAAANNLDAEAEFKHDERGFKGCANTPLTRKIDFACVIIFSVTYLVGSILILLVKMP